MMCLREKYVAKIVDLIFYSKLKVVRYSEASFFYFFFLLECVYFKMLWFSMGELCSTAFKTSRNEVPHSAL